MRFVKYSLLLSLFSFSLNAQKSTTGVSASAVSFSGVPTSNILKINTEPNELIKIEVKNAQYDFNKNNLPYFSISKKTAYNKTAVPTLITKKTQLVTSQYAQVIKKEFAKYLVKNFILEPISSLSRGENLNNYKLFPFRLNANDEVEELIDFEVNWLVNDNSNRINQTASTFTNNSVLSTGVWYKIGVTQTGIFKLDKAFLTSLGINVATLDPKKIRIYGNGGAMLPELNLSFRYDDLQENAIKVVGESDGVFDNGDYVLFYGMDVNDWYKSTGGKLIFDRRKHYYADTNFYFLNVDLGNGKRVVSQASSASPANVSTSSYDYYNYHELDQTNFIKSGRQFFGEYYDLSTSYAFSFNEGNFIVGDTIRAQISIAGRGLSPTLFSIYGNGLNTTITTTPVDINDYLSPYADIQTTNIKALNNNSGNITLTINKLTAGNIGWLDYITVNARRDLIANKQFQFRDSRISGTGNICNYTIANPANNNFTLWNVSDKINAIEQQYNPGTSASFVAAADSTIEYAVSPSNAYYTPTYVGKVANQNLHAIAQADFVIVTHPLFLSQAQRVANVHQQNEGFSYVIATTDQVYNEFSAGKPDAAAIRDFVRMLYTKNLASGTQPKHLLLLGDGSYNNISRNLSTNSNLIPTYQSPNSLSLLQSVATDDFYALMDPNEGANAESIGAMDIGIGRFTCRTVDEVNAVVAKIENYYRKDPNFKIANSNVENCTVTADETPLGDWRNWLIFMGDDEDQSTHMSQANTLANIVQTDAPIFNIDKIYLDAYQQYSTPGGQRFPDATADLQRRILKGALLFNYTGHGGEVGLTAERMLDIETINSWDNFNKLPLFVTATCEFSRYDDPGRTSAGELCLINPKGAAIGLLTTCRLAFSSTNFSLNTILFGYMFKKLPNGKKPCLGDIIRETKANLGQSIYFANFHLLGDPALTLAYPEQKISTSQINGSTVTITSSDTLGALAKITVKGMVTDTMGNKLTNFNGIVYPTVFDKEQDVTCLLNDASSFDGTPGNPFKFKLQKNILYRGKAVVTAGDFSFSFMVPKDISFAYGPGKISYYATNGVTDATGYYKNVVVGGGAKNVTPDNDGPKVSLFFNDSNFVSGGTTNEKPVLYANLIDSSGINTLGTGIGHDISAVIDANSSKPIILNDFYEASLNSYQSGRVRYQFDELSEGNHTISFKVWDIQNNSSVVNADFVVAKSEELALNHVLNYPNPFTTKTKFYFEHNQACNPLKVTVQIFTISGKLVKTLQRSVTCEGFRPEGIDWDGKDEYGDKLARGVYIYKVAILNSDNKKAEKTEKLVILN